MFLGIRMVGTEWGVDLPWFRHTTTHFVRCQVIRLEHIGVRLVAIGRRRADCCTPGGTVDHGEIALEMRVAWSAYAASNSSSERCDPTTEAAVITEGDAPLNTRISAVCTLISLTMAA